MAVHLPLSPRPLLPGVDASAPPTASLAQPRAFVLGGRESAGGRRLAAVCDSSCTVSGAVVSRGAQDPGQARISARRPFDARRGHACWAKHTRRDSGSCAWGYFGMPTEGCARFGTRLSGAAHLQSRRWPLGCTPPPAPASAGRGRPFSQEARACRSPASPDLLLASPSSRSLSRISRCVFVLQLYSRFVPFDFVNKLSLAPAPPPAVNRGPLPSSLPAVRDPCSTAITSIAPNNIHFTCDTFIDISTYIDIYRY